MPTATFDTIEAAIEIAWAASWLFGAGLRRYESGNLVSARI